MKTIKIIDIIMAVLFFLCIFEIEILSYNFMDAIIRSIATIYMPISMFIQSVLYFKETKRNIDK